MKVRDLQEKLKGVDSNLDVFIAILNWDVNATDVTVVDKNSRVLRTVLSRQGDYLLISS